MFIFKGRVDERKSLHHDFKTIYFFLSPNSFQIVGYDCVIIIFPLDLPIHQLAAQGELAKLTEKLDNGYEPDELDPEGLTPVHWACAHGQKDAVHLLVEKGGDINKKGRDAESSISFACCNGNKDLVKYLLDEKVEFDSHDWVSNMALVSLV